MSLRTLLSQTLLSILGCLLIVAPAGAQYNPPGTTIAGSDLTEEQDLRSGLEDASWRLGVLRLQPWIGIRDASFVTSSQDDENDFTASAGAGVRAYVKTGPKVIWAAHALPEYTWWADDEDKRRLNGRYGLGLFAYFNRLGLEVSARRNETQKFFSSELQELTTTRSDVARLAFELELTEHFFAVGGYTRSDRENVEDESPVFGRLDQKARTGHLGLGFRSPKGFSIEGRLEESENDFDENARDLSNTEEAAIIALGYEGQRFEANLSLERRTLEGEEGSDFADLETTTGFLETSWDLHRSVGLVIYGRRQLGYSIRDDVSNLVAERLGVRFDLGWQDLDLRVAAETGQDEFRSRDPGVDERVDDVFAVGMSLGFNLRRVLSLTLALTHTDYESDFPGFDRDVTAWTASLQLLELAERLGLGDQDRIW